MSSRSLASFAFAATVLTAACGAGTAGQAVRPADPKANDALGKKVSCTALSDEPQLLTLDWDDTLRIDLEQAMKKGVVAVKFDCNGFKVLRDCQVPGAYEYAGVSPAKTVAKIADEDQLQANLPVGAVSLSGEIKRGSTIDIIYMAVGQQTTTVHDVPAAKLTGTCEGATHTVRSANVGAFAITTGTKGEVNAAVQVLNKGGTADSKSSRALEHANGDLAECEKANDSATAPTAKCKALVQLLLSPVNGKGASTAETASTDAKDREAKSKQGSADPIRERCPEGFVADKSGICAKKDASTAGLCKIEDFDDCKAQCDKGNSLSCYNAGANRWTSKYNPKGSNKDAYPFMEKACSAGVAAGCGHLGFLTMWGYGTTKDHDKGDALLVKGCSAGDAWACRYLAEQYRYGMAGYKRDPAQFFNFNKRGCLLGEQNACVDAASALIDGIGTAKDMDAGIKLLEKACDAGDETTCRRANSLKGNVASHAGSGEKVKVADAHKRFGPDPIENPCGQGLRVGADGTCVKLDAGTKYLCDPADLEECKKLCDAGDGKSCVNAAANRVGKWNKTSKTGPEDAFPFLEKACTAGYAAGCGELANALHWGKGVKSNRDRSVGFYEKACTGGDALSCEFLGRNHMCSSAECNGIKKDSAKALGFYKKGCDLGDGNQCRDAGSAVERGSAGMKKDPKAAIEWFEKACKAGVTASCDHAKKLASGK